MSAADKTKLIESTADIVAAHVSFNSVPVADVPRLVTATYQALSSVGLDEPEEPVPEPAVPIRSSVKRDHIVCLEDGLKFKTLKRHLREKYDLTPDEYRKRWGLPSDYPMTAPGYSEARRKLAKDRGLGRKKGDTMAKLAERKANRETAEKGKSSPSATGEAK